MPPPPRGSSQYSSLFASCKQKVNLHTDYYLFYFTFTKARVRWCDRQCNVVWCKGNGKAFIKHWTWVMLAHSWEKGREREWVREVPETEEISAPLTSDAKWEESLSTVQLLIVPPLAPLPSRRDVRQWMLLVLLLPLFSCHTVSSHLPDTGQWAPRVDDCISWLH